MQMVQPTLVLFYITLGKIKYKVCLTENFYSKLIIVFNNAGLSGLAYGLTRQYLAELKRSSLICSTGIDENKKFYHT